MNKLLLLPLIGMLFISVALGCLAIGLNEGYMRRRIATIWIIFMLIFVAMYQVLALIGGC